MADQHSFFIVTAFVVFVLCIVGLIAWVTIDYRTQRRTLATLEARGVRRRSAHNPGETA